MEPNTTLPTRYPARAEPVPATANTPIALSLAAPVNFFAQRLQPIRLGADAKPMLQVIVDAEEEFDWSQPFDRRNDGVDNIAHQCLAQRIFERYGITPTYVVDHAVASQEKGFAPLRALLQGGSAEIGAHLQPWVNPPFGHGMDDYHSFPGNLAPELEREKLRTLTEAIERNFGQRPVVYRAGRYGLGPSSFEMLDELGYEIDASVLPGIDLGAKNGPNFAGIGPDPFWFGAGRRRLGIPLSAGYTGILASAHRTLDRVTNWKAVERSRLKAAASRFGLFDRMNLSPEGFTLEEQKRLTRTLIGRGHRVFTLSYHSPSLLPGCTPYVRDVGELDAFLGRLEAYLVWFGGEIGGSFVTPLEIKAALDAGAPSAA
jgi:hypothetical protein